MRNDYNREQNYSKSSNTRNFKNQNRPQWRSDEEDDLNYQSSTDFSEDLQEGDNDYYYSSNSQDGQSWNTFENDDINQPSRYRGVRQSRRGGLNNIQGPTRAMERSGYYNQNFAGRGQEYLNFDTEFAGLQGLSRSYDYGRDNWQDGESSSQGQSFYGKGPKSYKRSDDRIKEDVCDCLTDDPNIDASNIEVDVQQGCVTFTGTVPTTWMKYETEMMVESITGVTDVENELKVQKKAKGAQNASDYSDSSDRITASSSSASTFNTNQTSDAEASGKKKSK